MWGLWFLIHLTLVTFSVLRHSCELISIRIMRLTGISGYGARVGCSPSETVLWICHEGALSQVDYHPDMISAIARMYNLNKQTVSRIISTNIFDK